MRARWGILLLALSATGCGKELGRVPLHDEGTGDTKVTLKGGKDVALWTKLDVAYAGNFAASYTVELVDGSSTVDTAVCNPLDVSTRLSAVETNIGSERSVRYEGKMRCKLTPPKDGTYTIRTKLAFPAKPAKLDVKDISLIVKV
jgi:hypothetical protein